MRLIILSIVNLLLVYFSAFADTLPVKADVICDKSGSNNQFKCNLNLDVKDGWKVYFHDEDNESLLNFKLNTEISRNIDNILINWLDSEKYYDNCLSLPMFPTLTHGEQQYVMMEIDNFFNA